jgi:hypothetical protein
MVSNTVPHTGLTIEPESVSKGANYVTEHPDIVPETEPVHVPNSVSVSDVVESPAKTKPSWARFASLAGTVKKDE